MESKVWLAVGALLLVALSAKAEITKGVISVTGAEMDGGGGLVRDTIARQSDVEKSSVKMEIEPGNHKYRIGIITFAAKKGKSIDLEKVHEGIKATRLSGKTRSEVKYLEITAEGEVTSTEKETQLKVNGTTLQFVLSDDRSAKPKKGAQAPLERLREALAKGEKVVSVTGRVQGWTGLWPEVLREFPGQPAENAKEQDKPASKKQPVLLVKDFQIAQKGTPTRVQRGLVHAIPRRRQKSSKGRTN